MGLSKLAESIARDAHKGQYRRDGVTPYIVHPKAVAENFSQAKLKAVAWLHDVIEDCPNIGLDDLMEKGIPYDVAMAVSVLTERKNETYLQYILRVKENDMALVVKLADMMDNRKTAGKKKKIIYAMATYILKH